MPERPPPANDTCSYERRVTKTSRRHQLLACLFWLTCSAFTWPGRAAHLSYTVKHGSLTERVEALRLLEDNPSAASDAILAALEDDASEVRTQAARSVIAASDSRATSNLLDLARAREPEERAAALRALGRSGSARAQATLEQALEDPIPAVQLAAAEGLTSFVSHGGGKPLAAELTSLFSQGDTARQLAGVALLDALATAKDAAALSARSSQLRQAARDSAPEVRAAALRALGHLRDGRVLPDLQNALSDKDENVRLWAISALGDSNLAGAVSPLRARAGGAELRSAMTALAALGRIDDSSALGAIAPQLTRAPLAQFAVDALITRARRLHNESALREGAEALRHAIETTREDEALSPLAQGLVELARLSLGPQLAAAPQASASAQLSPSAAEQNEARPQAQRRSATNPAQLSSGAAGLPSSTSAAQLSSTAAALATPTAAAQLTSTAAALATPTAVAQLTSTAAAQHSSTAASLRSTGPGALTATATAAASTELGSPAFRALFAAQLSLLHALESGRGDVTILATSLMELRNPELLPALLTRAEHETPDTLPKLLDAVVSTLRVSRDAAAIFTKHAAQLKQLLLQPGLPPTAASALVQLRSLIGLDTSEEERDPAHRRVLAQLWAEVPQADTTQRNQKLLSWLDDNDEQVRHYSSVALARAAGPAELSVLTARLEEHAPHPVLSLQACAGALLRTAATLPGTLRERLLKQLHAYLEHPDEELAMNALFALRSSSDPRAARWIAQLLRGSSLPLRTAALQALGDFDEQDARRLLRDTLRGDNNQSASSAALALAELGSDRDVEALLRAAERGSWPLQPTAAYAAARITQRAQTRKHSLERVLCRFAQQHDSYALANSVSALATLAADACDEQIEPSALLDPALPSALRASAATWLRAIDSRSARLASCAEDRDRSVSNACAPLEEAPETSGRTLLRLFEPDGHTPLRERTVALRLPNASVYIGRSDHAGQLLLPRAIHGEILLEDPADSGGVTLPLRAAPESP